MKNMDLVGLIPFKNHSIIQYSKLEFLYIHKIAGAFIIVWFRKYNWFFGRIPVRGQLLPMETEVY